jgi:DNA repair protein RadA/Sms
MPTRVFSGIDNNRGKLLVAVAQKVLGLPLYKYDVYLSVTGGIKIEDTGVDLAVVAAMWSSYKEKPLVVNQKKELVFIGEVSLLGEVKKVRNWEKRVKEARALDREVVEMENVGELRTLVKG